MADDILNPIDVIIADIEAMFFDYCQKYNIDINELVKEKSNTRFNGGMTYIYRNYFKDTNKLKAKPSYTVKESINNMVTNHNAYNINILYELYLFIKEFANGYNKLATVAAFKSLTGISKQTISNWHSGLSSSRLDTDKKEFVKFLYDCELDQLKEFNFVMPYGAQEQLNVDHGRQKETIITHQTVALSNFALPKLGEKLSDNSPQMIAEKPPEVVAELCENRNNLESP